MNRSLSPTAVRLRLLRGLAACALILLCSPTLAGAAGAGTSIYRHMRDITAQEILADGEPGERDAAPLVKQWISALYTLEEGEVRVSDIPQALNDDIGFCEPQPPIDDWDGLSDVPGQYRAALSPSQCIIVEKEIQDLAKGEMDVRTLAADLRAIAGGYEQAVMNPDVTGNLLLRASAITRIWRAGQSGTGGALGYRTRKVPKSAVMEQAFEDLSDELNELVGPGGDDEQLVAAVTRYWLGGYRFVGGQRTEEFPPPLEARVGEELGTEPQYLYHRWDKVEEILDRIWMNLPDLGEERALDDGEIALYEFPAAYQAKIPGGAQVWAYHEQNGDDLSGDVGLNWLEPLKAVVPSPCDRDPVDPNSPCGVIGGGIYPLAPRPGTALCTHPLARLGYLCRPLQGPANECEEQIEPIPGKIILAACTTPGGDLITDPGPLSCDDVDWKDPKQFDPETECDVDFSCKSGPFSGGITRLKEGNGRIDVSVSPVTDVPARYIALHELVHARFFCSREPGYNLYGFPTVDETLTEQQKQQLGCCIREGEAYRVSCEIMAKDGIFEGEPMSSLGIPMNEQTCSELFTNYSCEQRFETACPNTIGFDRFTPDEELRFLEEVNQLGMERAPDDVARTCGEMVDELTGAVKDPYVAAAIREIEQMGDKPCDPHETTEYENTIGNNMCYFDQCVRQSTQHRLFPARLPAGTQDQGNATDTCVRPDPMYETISTTIGTGRTWTMPPYRVEMLVREMDRALCTGLAPSALPVLCSFNAAAGIQYVQQSPADVSAFLLDLQKERQEAIDDLRDVLAAVGARVGNRLYSRYLQGFGDSLAELPRAAADLLENFPRATFTREMCPRSGTQEFLLGETCSEPYEDIGTDELEDEFTGTSAP